MSENRYNVGVGDLNGRKLEIMLYRESEKVLDEAFKEFKSIYSQYFKKKHKRGELEKYKNYLIEAFEYNNNEYKFEKFLKEYFKKVPEVYIDGFRVNRIMNDFQKTLLDYVNNILPIRKAEEQLNRAIDEVIKLYSKLFNGYEKKDKDKIEKNLRRYMSNYDIYGLKKYLRRLFKQNINRDEVDREAEEMIEKMLNFLKEKSKPDIKSESETGKSEQNKSTQETKPEQDQSKPKEEGKPNNNEVVTNKINEQPVQYQSIPYEGLKEYKGDSWFRHLLGDWKDKLKASFYRLLKGYKKENTYWLLRTLRMLEENEELGGFNPYKTISPLNLIDQYIRGGDEALKALLADNPVFVDYLKRKLSKRYGINLDDEEKIKKFIIDPSTLIELGLVKDKEAVEKIWNSTVGYTVNSVKKPLEAIEKHEEGKLDYSKLQPQTTQQPTSEKKESRWGGKILGGIKWLFMPRKWLPE